MKTGYQLDKDLEARLQNSLPRLLREGLVKPYETEKWPARGERRLWGLTVKGFLLFLCTHRRSFRRVVRAVEVYQDLLSYETHTVPVTRIDDRKGTTYRQGKPQLTNEPVLPIKLQKEFRRRVGDKTYFDCLVYPGLEIDLQRRDALLEALKSHPSTASRLLQRQQENYARSFTLGFLGNIFQEIDQKRMDIKLPKPHYGEPTPIPTMTDQDKRNLDSLESRHPDKRWYDYLDALFNEETGRLRKQIEILQAIQRDALTFFNPTP